LWWWVTEQQTGVPSVAPVVVLLREELQRQLAAKGMCDPSAKEVSEA